MKDKLIAVAVGVLIVGGLILSITHETPYEDMSPYQQCMSDATSGKAYLDIQLINTMKRECKSTGYISSGSFLRLVDAEIMYHKNK